MHLGHVMHECIWFSLDISLAGFVGARWHIRRKCPWYHSTASWMGKCSCLYAHASAEHITHKKSLKTRVSKNNIFLLILLKSLPRIQLLNPVLSDNPCIWSSTSQGSSFQISHLCNYVLLIMWKIEFPSIENFSFSKTRDLSCRFIRILFKFFRK